METPPVQAKPVSPYNLECISEHEKFVLLTHVDMDEGKLYIRIIERNIGATSWGAPQHHILPGLSIFSFPVITNNDLSS